ncbi:hypothetical protein GALMADRAFT_232147 [Galerina marginata CBS 339.88]|uniref:Uncharacterized protein n=1 Tax=Galerina marginata (strain CBS 339.88) TaxID=685588 RepID=A0A067S8X2_GALM3|nr:hypothetical protein GALMADRAFT_232147 [Galerina marginata CBS 339.88]
MFNGASPLYVVQLVALLLVLLLRHSIRQGLAFKLAVALSKPAMRIGRVENTMLSSQNTPIGRTGSRP